MRLYDEAPIGITSRARVLRRHATDVERLLWRGLREKLPAHKWRRQVPVGPYIADFLNVSAQLVIELDGGQHAEGGDYDARRTAFIEAQGYRVLRFWNNEVSDNLDAVMAAIAAAVNARQTASPSPSHDAAHRGAHPSPAGRGI